MLQGDAHRLYRRLRTRWPVPPSEPLPLLDQAREIAEYYRKLPPAERELLLAWAEKEDAGIGLIPLVVSAIPFTTLLFAPLIQRELGDMAPGVWMGLWGLAATGSIAAVWVHQRQRAYTRLHLTLLRRTCGDESPTR